MNTWNDIKELEVSIIDYLDLLMRHDFGCNECTMKSVNRLHQAIANLEIDELWGILKLFNVNQTSIFDWTVDFNRLVDELKDLIGRDMGRYVVIDKDIAEVFQYCDKLDRELSSCSFEMVMKTLIDPTKDDERTNSNLQLFIRGSYGDIDFGDFADNYLMGGLQLSKNDMERRFDYLIANCADDSIKAELNAHKDKILMRVEENEQQLDVRDDSQPMPDSPTIDPLLEPKRAKMGRKVDDFKKLIMVAQKEEYLTRLHEKIDKSDYKVVTVILANEINNERLLRPSYASFHKEFPTVKVNKDTFKKRLTKRIK